MYNNIGDENEKSKYNRYAWGNKKEFKKRKNKIQNDTESGKQNQCNFTMFEWTWCS